MELRDMQDGLHETQVKCNAIAEQMKEVENGMVRLVAPLSLNSCSHYTMIQQEIHTKLQKIGRKKAERQKDEVDLSGSRFLLAIALAYCLPCRVED